VANANRFSSAKQMKVTSLNNYSEEPSAASLNASVRSSVVRSIRQLQTALTAGVLNDEFVFGLLGLVPSHLPRGHILFSACSHDPAVA